MPEAAQRLTVFWREARKFFSIIQLSCQEIALVASRYIEGRALTSCSSTLSLSIQAEIKHTAIFLEFESYSDRNTRVQSSMATRKKIIGTKSGAAQAAPAAPLPTALHFSYLKTTVCQTVYSATPHGHPAEIKPHIIDRTSRLTRELFTVNGGLRCSPNTHGCKRV